MSDAKRLTSARSLDMAVRSSAPAETGGDQESPLAIVMKLHRAMRGRYLPAIILSAVGAVGGAVLGYSSTYPKYQSIGMIRVRPVIENIVGNNPDNSMMTMFQSYVRSQANYLQTPRTISMALNSTEWREAGGEGTDEAQREFERKLDIRLDPGEAEWIRIFYTDRDAKKAKTAVEQVIQAYWKLYVDPTRAGNPATLEFLDQVRRQREKAVAQVDMEIEAITEKYGTDNLESFHSTKFDRLQSLEQQEYELTTALSERKANANSAAKTAEDKPKFVEPAGIDTPVEKIMRVDPELRMMAAQKLDLESEVDRKLNLGYTEKHREVIRLRGHIAALQKKIEQSAEAWRQQHPEGVEAMLDGQISDQRWANSTQEEIENKLKAIEGIKGDLQKQVEQVNRDKLRLAASVRKKKEATEDLDDVRQKIKQSQLQNTVESELKDAGRITVVSPGEVASAPSIDNRFKYALMGLVLGGGLPIAAFLLWGFSDRRFRYSDDSMSKRQDVTLLGILPSLPENMNDPEQAGVAAHCVHQIRTLLQLGGVHDKAQVFVITSPTSGDGKTSLSLSLGMSFAAAGSRTLLMDFDMIGCGLTRAMNAKTDRGTMAATDAGQISGYVVATAFKRLSLLPSGLEDAQEVGRLSPTAVRRLLEQARRDYDVVIVDTGPILGSLEANMVAAQADGVVLTMGRGQQKALAERAVDQLRSVGARLLGVVFNKADPMDFKRSVSSASVRSVPASTNALAVVNGAARGARMGPVANVVAASMGSEPEHGHGTSDRGQTKQR